MCASKTMIMLLVPLSVLRTSSAVSSEVTHGAMAVPDCRINGWREASEGNIALGKRRNAAMAFDSNRNVVVLFGGLIRNGSDQFLSDTWEWDGSSWTCVFNCAGFTGGPSARYAGEMVYDSSTQKCVLYGGGTAGTLFDEMWEWDGSSWTQLCTGCDPGARSTFGMSYDSDHARIVVFGGNGTMGRLGDTWEWDGSTWTQGSAGGMTDPTPRETPSMTYDPSRMKTVLYGGNEDPTNHRNDTWEWDGSSWTQVNTAGGAPTPTADPGHRLVYDSHLSAVLLFGGGEAGTVVNESWIWDGNVWSKLGIVGSVPEARFFHSLAYDSVNQVAVVFGGVVGSTDFVSNYRGDTWTLDTTCLPEGIPAASTWGTVALVGLILSVGSILSMRTRRLA